MAQLKNTIILGDLSVTGAAHLAKTYTNILNVPTTSGGTTYGPGTNGQALLSNGTTVYWGTALAASTAEALTSNAGSTTQPIYFSGGKPIATQFALKATVNNGTASRIAYYSGANAISSGSIVTDGGYLGSVSYLTINAAHQTTNRLYVNGSAMIGAASSASNHNLIVNGKVVINPSYNTPNSYNEGIRINQASNGWANINFGGAADSTSGTQDGQWLVGRRGAAGSSVGAVGDFTIEEQGSYGQGLTIHKDSGGATLYTTKTAVKPSFTIINTATPSSGSYLYGAAITDNNMVAGSNYINVFGKAISKGNIGYIGYQWAGSDSGNNFVTIGHHSYDHLLRVYQNGSVAIGAADNNYKLYVNGTTYLGGNVTISGSKISCINLGEGLEFNTDGNYFGSNSDARTIDMIDTNPSANSSAVDGGIVFRAIGRVSGTDTIQELLRIRNHNGSSEWKTGEFQWKTKDVVVELGTTAKTWNIAIAGNAATATNTTYTRYLENRGGSTVSIADSSWGVQITPSGNTNQATVWHQRWKQSGLTYTPSGGSATTLTDSADIRYWLSSSTTSNSLQLNIQMDGRLYALNGGSFGWTNTSYALTAASALINSWIRTKGATGWYNEDYAGGWYMPNATWVQLFNNKQVKIQSNHATSTTNLSSQLIISSLAYNGADTTSGADVAIELWRGSNASWQIVNSSGTLIFRNNYTSAKQSTYSQQSITLDYNTGTLNTKHITNQTDLTYDIGSSTKRYLNIYGNVLRLQGAASNPSASAGARIEFAYDSSSTGRDQPVYISYTPNDSYRSPAGLKIFGGTSATPAWLEVEGKAYASEFVGALSGNATSATKANLTTTANAVAYFTDTAGTFGSKASANGALYATSANGALTFGTLPTAQGGTGNTSYTASRLVYTNTATKLASSSITSDGEYLGSVSYLSVNTAHQTSYRFYVNGTSYFNNRLTIPKPINQIVTGTGTAASDGGSSASPNRYKPARWTFNTGMTVTDGDILTIKIPVAGHSHGVFMSIDNGTTYKPVVTNGTTRVTTHYPANTYITVIYEASGSAADMFALAGSDSRTTISGGVWRVINYYDSNSNDTGYYILTNGFRLVAGGTYKVWRYSLFARLANGTYESFTTSSGTGTKAKNTHGFVPDGKIYWNSASSDYSGTTNFSPYEQYHSIDYRYTFNISTSGIPANANTYIKWTYNAADGLLYLADEWFATTLPTTEDGFIYQRIGSNYYGSADYRGSLLLNNPYYIYKGSNVQLWTPGNVTISSIDTSTDWYYPTMHTDTSGTGITLKGSDCFRFSVADSGKTHELIIGKAQSREKSSLWLFNNDKSIQIKPSSSTSNSIALNLPTSSGTLELVGHTHTADLATDTGTSSITLSHGGKYKLTAGGSSVIFTMPSSGNTDTKVSTAAVTSGTTYYPVVGADTTSAATKFYDKTGFVYKGTNGTTSTVGSAILTLGNSTASGTANNKQGQIVLYGSTAYATTITPGAPTAARTITLPNTSGTVALEGNMVALWTGSQGSGGSAITITNAMTTYSSFIFVFKPDGLYDFNVSMIIPKAYISEQTAFPYADDMGVSSSDYIVSSVSKSGNNLVVSYYSGAGRLVGIYGIK